MSLTSSPGVARQVPGVILAMVWSFTTSTLLITPIDAFGVESATLDQCANGSLGIPDLTPCQGDEAGSIGWINGNLGDSKAHYLEGQSISYRLRFGDLAVGLSTEVIIEWDITTTSKHAIDYLTTWNRSVDSHPYEGVFAGPEPTPTTYPITMDPQADAQGVVFPADDPAPVFTLWGGTIVSTSEVTYPDGLGFTGDKSARIAITFVADVSNPVLAWGGHISTRADWGIDTGYNSTSGSPFHARLIELNGVGANQDRSMSATAVIYPASITLVKDTIPAGAKQDFDFTVQEVGGDSTGLVLNAATHPGDSVTDILIVGIEGLDFTITETSSADWNLEGVNCSFDYFGGGSYMPTMNGFDLNIREGEEVSCVITNTVQPNPFLALDKHSTAIDTAGNGVLDTAGDVVEYDLVVTNTGNITLTNVVVTDPLTATNVNIGDLLPDESDTVTVFYAITQADLDTHGGGDGDIDNTATAGSDQTDPTQDSEAVPLQQAPVELVFDDGFENP